MLRKVKKSRRNLTVIQKLETSLPEPDACNRADGVRDATVDLDPDEELLPFDAARISYSRQLTSENGHSNTQDLTRADVSVKFAAFLYQTIKIRQVIGLHYAFMHRG